MFALKIGHCVIIFNGTTLHSIQELVAGANLSKGGYLIKKRVHDVDTLIKSGPYSHVVEAGGFLFVSGMVSIDFENQLRITDDIKAATELALVNVKKALESVGSRLEKVVKVTVFLRDTSDFNSMNEVYRAFFPKESPARSCVVVKEIPGGFPLEIEVIAIK